MSEAAARFVCIAAFTARQVLARRKTLLLVALALMPAAFGVVIRRFAPSRGGDPFYTVVGNFYAAFLCQTLSLFYGAGLIRDAVENRTACFFLTTPTSRRLFTFASLTGMLVPLTALIAVSCGVTFAVWRTGVDGFADTGPLLNLMAVAAAGCVVYGAVFTLIGMWIRYSTVVGIAFYAVFDLGLAFMPGGPRRATISAYLDALLEPPFRTRAQLYASDPAFADAVIAPVTAKYALVGLLIVVCALIARRATTRDFADDSASK